MSSRRIRRHTVHRHVLVVVLVAGALWAPTGLPSEFDFGFDDPMVFEEVIDVRVIHVEAVVTRRGEPVQGLDVDDFVLEVDGEPVPIEYFTEVRGGLSHEPTAPAAVASVPALPAGRPVPTSYLVFVDDDFTIESRRDRVLRGLAEQLGEMGPEDRMAVVAWDGRRLELLNVWTRSHAELTRALRRAEGRPAYGLHRRSEWRRLADDLRLRSRATGSRSFAGIGFAGARRLDAAAGEASSGARDILGSEVGSRVARVASAAGSALRGLGGVEGRKVLLMISGGMPSLGHVGLESDLALDGFVEADQLEAVRQLYRPVIEAANRLGFTLYPVDAGDRISAGLVGADAATLGQAQRLRGLAARQRFFSEDVFFHLAERTGGDVITSSAASRALARVREDTRAYYWLGFTPTWRFDDAGHEVTVRLRDRDLDVRSRKSFADLSSATRATLAVESAHLFDVPVPGSEPLDVALGDAEPAGLGRLLVPLDLRLPIDALTFLDAGGEESVARLELRVAA
ncbi:MAG: VWA domain-containing protein, partial [Acidobacteriota bacterium]